MLLLVSVISDLEVIPAIEGGADIIDVKNPREGTLGANFPRVIRAVREATPPAFEVSATIGDAPNLPGTMALAALGASLCGAQYVKVGMFGMQDPQDALFLLENVCQAVREHDPNIKVIAAGYADAHKINALLPLDLPAVAIKAGADGCLIDTALKGAGTLLTNLDDTQLREFVRQCHEARLLCALAGALDVTDLPYVAKLGADIIGVRTAACSGDRVNGRVDRQKVRRLKSLLSAHASPLCDPSPAIPSAGRGFPR